MMAINSSEPGKFSDLQLRALSALVLSVLTIWITFKGGLIFHYFSLIISILVFWEYAKICQTRLPVKIAIVGVSFLLLSALAYDLASGFVSVILCLAGLVILTIWQKVTNGSYWAALGLFYSSGLFYSLVMLRSDPKFGFAAMVILYAIVWGGDSAAFFTGRLIGGAKLAPTISPKKTWAGFVGGIIGSVLMVLLVCQLFSYQLRPILIVLLTIALAIVGQIGDLFESWLKRRFEVKDSGSLIPGHGGVLDRVDSLIFSSITLWFAGILSGIGDEKWPETSILSALISSSENLY